MEIVGLILLVAPLAILVLALRRSSRGPAPLPAVEPADEAVELEPQIEPALAPSPVAASEPAAAVRAAS